MKTTPISLKRLEQVIDSKAKQTSKKAPSKSFGEVLSKSMEEVNQLQEKADKAIEELATGETKDIAQAMIAVEKANISFKLMTQVRNKIVEAYEEVMRMPV